MTTTAGVPGAHAAVIPVLTIRQPWAWAIVSGGKDVENRTWATAHRGRIGIHAAVTPPSAMDIAAVTAAGGVRPPQELELGAILAIATLIEITTTSASRWAEPGHYHWRLTHVTPLPSLMRCRGQLGLWTASAALSRYDDLAR